MALPSSRLCKFYLHNDSSYFRRLLLDDRMTIFRVWNFTELFHFLISSHPHSYLYLGIGCREVTPLRPLGGAPPPWSRKADTLPGKNLRGKNIKGEFSLPFYGHFGEDTLHPTTKIWIPSRLVHSPPQGSTVSMYYVRLIILCL